MAEIRRILRREEIADGERYVLVMNGLAKTETYHPLGATFTVVNSPANRLRDADLRAALTTACEFANRNGIGTVFLLE